MRFTNNEIIIPLKLLRSMLIEKALKKHHGNRRKAAEEVGISEKAVYNYLRNEKEIRHESNH